MRTTYLSGGKSADNILPRDGAGVRNVGTVGVRGVWYFPSEPPQTSQNQLQPTAPHDTFELEEAFFDLTFPNPELLKVPKLCISKIHSAKLSPLETEKLFWFCDHLHATGASTEKGAPVNTRFFQRRLGTRGTELVRRLVDLRLIEKCENHSTGLRCSRYRFVEKIRSEKSTKPFKLKNKRLIRNRGSKTHYTKARNAGARIPAKLLDDLSRITAGPEFLTAFDTMLADMEREGKALGSMETLRDFWEAGHVRMSVKVFRITSHICGTPVDLRALLLVEGKQAYELDFANNHPAMLTWLFSPTDNSKDAEREQHANLVNLVQSGLFYDSFMQCWDADRHVFVDFAVSKRFKTKGKKVGKLKPLKQVERERQEFRGKKPRPGIKLCWQMIINSAPSFYETQIMTELAHRFPFFTVRLCAYKARGKDALGSALRRKEAELIIAIAAGVDEPIATIYDGFLTSEAGVPQVIESARIETLKLLEFVHLPVERGKPKGKPPDAAANGEEAPC